MLNCTRRVKPRSVAAVALACAMATASTTPFCLAWATASPMMVWVAFTWLGSGITAPVTNCVVLLEVEAVALSESPKRKITVGP